MKIFQIGTQLKEIAWNEREDRPVIAVLQSEESEQGVLPLVKPEDIPAFQTARFSKAEVRRDFLCGTVCIPSHSNQKGKVRFAYIIRTDFILFVDNSGFVISLLQNMSETKTWKSPGIGHVLCDILEEMIANELSYIQDLENRIARMEDAALCGTLENFNSHMISFRKEVLALFHYYSQLSEIGAIFQEDENGLFRKEDRLLFRMFTERVNRLREETQILREYSTQVQEMYQAQIDIRQNQIMKILTVVTAVFLPLSLIAGWYGMNFAFMPELKWKYGYIFVILLSAAVVLLCIWLFRKKKFW